MMLILTLMIGLDRFGPPEIAPFFNGAAGAVSLQFDDSMPSQLQNAVPLLKARGLHATFFVNPGQGHYKAHSHDWEVELPAAGHEIGNHTMNHTGAKDATEAEKQIAECSDVINRLPGRHPRLVSFAVPGGVPWKVTAADTAPVFKKYCLVQSNDRIFFDEKQVDPVTFAQRAVANRNWAQIGMHGTGGEWLSTSIPTLTRLLDFLVANHSTVWTEPTIDVYKYIQERNAVEPLRLTSVSASGFSLKVRCDPAKLQTFGRPAASLYDQPLTVEVPVPATWSAYRIEQGKSRTHGKTVDAGGKHLARFSVDPNGGVVHVEIQAP